MRIWSIHPRYLDAHGLVALWRETLLAQAVLHNETIGYRNHPQLHRFKQCADPVSSISNYLLEIYKESQCRGYSFDKNKIKPSMTFQKIPLSSAQLEYEWKHLMNKLKNRSPNLYDKWVDDKIIMPHPLFCVFQGNEIEEWEHIIK